MSFNNQIFGSVPSSPAMIYTSTNMSSENISCTNLSGSIATFDQLEVVTFNPISFSADYADITNLSCDNLSVQFKSTMGSISTGNISAAEITLTGDINASEVNASAINASAVYADNISTSTITCLSNISTPRLYVNDTFFYGSTGSIVASLVTMSSQVLYNLGDLDFKIISVSGTQYLTCDNTLGNVNISNLSVDNLAATIGRIEDLRAQDASVFGNVSVYGNIEAIGRVRVGGIDFKESTSGFKVAYLDVNTASLKMYLNKSMEFRKQDDSGIVFMKYDFAKSNVNISNLSCANLSTNLLNNISAGEGISLSTEAGTNKLVITATGELNSSNLSLDNLSTVATSVQEIEYRNNPAGMKSYVSVNSGSVKQYHYSSWLFQKDNEAGIVFMKIDYAAENINISNLSCANISTNLLNNISAGENITLSTEAGTNKLVITSVGGLNSSNLSLDNLSVTASFTCNDAQIDDLFNCDMTNSLKAGSNISYPFADNLSVGFDGSSLDTTILMNPNISMYGIELLPDLYLNPPTFVMNLGRAELTAANISNLSVQTEFTAPSATITDLTIPASGTLNHDFAKNFTAGSGINISHVANQVTISAVNSVSANVPVSDFIETLQIIPSGTRPFLTQAINQMSIDVNVHNYQGGTAYSPSNMFTVYAGDKIVFNWKQSGWKQNNPAELSFICYLVSGVGPATSTNRIPVGRIYQYIYPQSDHEEISGTFVYNVSSTFSFYRSQIEGTGGMVTQGNDYGAATATVYRASVPNSIVVPNLIDATNISVDNLSISGDTDMIGKLTVGNIEFKNIGSTAVVSYLQTNMPSMKWFLNKTMDFRKDDDAGIVFMKLDHNVGNVNISNLSCANVSADNISTTIFSTTQIRLKDPADIEATKGSIFCNPNAFQFFGPDFRFINNTVVPNTDYMRMDQTRSNVNISNLSSTNTSILNDMTITRDLDVDRYLSYKPRFLTRWRDSVYGITGTAQDVQFDRDETAMAGGALQVSGDGIQALLAGWYRVDWSVGYRKLNNNGGERLTARTYLRINNVFYGKYGFGSTTYLRSSTINCVGYSSGSQLVYANQNDIIHVRTDCAIQTNTDFTSDFGGQRILASTRFSCEYVSNSGES